MEMFVDGPTSANNAGTNTLSSPGMSMYTQPLVMGGNATQQKPLRATLEQFTNSPASSYRCQTQQSQTCVYTAQGDLNCGKR